MRPPLWPYATGLETGTDENQHRYSTKTCEAVTCAGPTTAERPVDFQ